MSSLRLVLGDQLHESVSSLNDVQATDDLIVLMEVKPEADYAKHHKRKLVFIFSAMRHFAENLKDKFRVKYFKLDDEDNKHSFVENIKVIIESEQLDKLILTEPAEYRLLKQFEAEFSSVDFEVEIRSDDRFFTSKKEFKEFAESQKDLRLENFYRSIRKKTGYLMEANGKPVGGKWNYDHENRSAYKFKEPIPERLSFEQDEITKEVISLVMKNFQGSFGDCEEFDEAVTHEQALKVFHYFLQNFLPLFGKYQDAMIQDNPFMFHSRISHYINIGILPVSYVCDEVIKKVGDVPLSSIEGFLRQIIGWREYIRGVYWLKMPDYLDVNYFNHSRELPEFFWNGETELNCAKSVIESTRKYAYSHHIQRLMITGNIALLMGVKPIEVHEWYLGVYDDAYEWVELPNTFGMALYADGGFLSTKPYIASGNYINKMSNFCKGCRYNVKLKVGEDACPFNYLYWNFLHENKDKLSSNRRLFMPYRNLSKKTEEELSKIQSSAKIFLESNK